MNEANGFVVANAAETTSSGTRSYATADDATIDPKITSYAAIGDCRSVAMISRQGSIDWLCLPTISSPSLFAAMLDRQRGGRFAVRPTAAFMTQRRYLDATNVLETTFVTAHGRVRVTDLMVINGAEGGGLECEREVLRIAEGVEGEVELEVIYQPRPDYARIVPRLVKRGMLGWFFQCAGEAVLLQAELDLDLIPGAATLRGTVVLQPGHRRRLSLSHATQDALIVPTLGAEADRRLGATVRWWRNWSDQCQFDHRYRAVVLRSALALKLLTYGLSGAVVAAATTSLPEAIGAGRNYDYRFCWLRDAATMLRAFTALGFTTEAQHYLQWLLHSTRLTRPRLMVMYDVYGRTNLKLKELSHLTGYRGSQPVRIGNDAADQLQMDVYASAIAAAAEQVKRGKVLTREEKRLLVNFGRIICKMWREPDSGLWEIPGDRRHYVHSKLMCWSGLEVLIGLHETEHLVTPKAFFERERDAIRAEIETRGFDQASDSYIGAYGEDWIDASLLVMARLGYYGSQHPRIVSTADRIWRELGSDGLLWRYKSEVDGLASREGSFTICAFWAVELLAQQGRLVEANTVFNRVLSLANDVGLLAEEFDPASAEGLGNVPQAFSHAGLISAAIALADAEKQYATESAHP